MTTHRTIAAFFVCTVSLLAAAAGQAELESGATFVGKLGTLDVVVCLDTKTMEGRYYYPKIGKTISLERELIGDEEVLLEVEPSGFRSEPEDAAQWHLERSDGGKLTGSWTPPLEARKKGRKPLHLDLRQTAATCGEFESRRMNVPDRPIPAAKASIPQVELRRHGLADVVRPHLIGGAPRPVLDSINARLDDHYKKAVADSFDCRDYAENVRVEMYREVLVADYDGGSYCGGAHPNEFFSILAFDLRNGELLNDSGGCVWFQEFERDLAKATGGLSAMLSGEVDEVDCRQSLEALSCWPTGEGMAFRLWTDVRASAGCRQDVFLPYAKVRPFVQPQHRQVFDTWSKLLSGQKPVVASSEPPE